MPNLVSKSLRRFDQTINYSSVNEDSQSELKALCLKPHDVVLCITGSGARPLDLLTVQPRKIIAIDMNPLQNYLLEMKMAAIQQLSYDDYLAFLGVRPSTKRQEIYQALQPYLSEPAKIFWKKQRQDIKKGVLFQGRWERYYRQLARVLRAWRPQKLPQLFTCEDIESQRDFYARHWNTPGWRRFVRWVCQRRVSQMFFRDPAFYQFVPAAFDIAHYILQRMDRSFSTHLARRNYFMSLLFFNYFINEEFLPPHLQRAHFRTLRENLHAVVMVSQSLQAYLDSVIPQSLDKFSLSDISSYTSATDYEGIWRGILWASSPGAMVCARHFLVKRELPESIRPHVQRFCELEGALEQSDLSNFYSFTVAKVV